MKYQLLLFFLQNKLSLTNKRYGKLKRPSKLDNPGTSAVNTGHTHTRYRTKTKSTTQKTKKMSTPKKKPEVNSGSDNS